MKKISHVLNWLSSLKIAILLLLLIAIACAAGTLIPQQESDQFYYDNFNKFPFLGSFAIGQIVPLFVAGTFAASIPKLLSLRPIGKWVPPISGVILLTIGLISLLSIWI